MVGFEARIADRLRRWQQLGQPHWSAKYSRKLDGIDYVRGLGYAVPETYGTYRNLSEVRLADLPKDVVLKPQRAHSSHGVFAIRDGIDQFTGKQADLDWMLTEAGENANDAYMAEELLVNFDGRPGAPLDYKFYCFGSRVACVMIIERNTIKGDVHLNRCWYRTPDWKPLPMRFRWNHLNQTSEPPRPPFLDDLFAMASDLGGRFNIFLRVDLYATTRGPVFGEFTPFPDRGRFTTPLTDLWLSSLWRGLEGCGDEDERALLVAAE